MSSSTHEIVTLQLGHYANFVGTHWWNIQEASFIYDPAQAAGPKEINHDVMFREGHNLQGEVTFTPRLVSFDLKGSLNTLKQDGCLYDLPDVADDVRWGCDVTMHKGSSLPKNEFLRDLEKQDMTLAEQEEPAPEGDTEESEIDKDATETTKKQSPNPGMKLYDLNNSVQVWSDYLKIHLHPRTVHVIEQYTHNNSSEPFDVYHQGGAVYKDHRTRREMEDKIHFFLEECDHLQGMHILTDVHNGFGGLTGSLLQELEDELENKSLLVLPVSPPYYGETTVTQDAYRVMSTALTFEKLANHSSAIIPMSLASSYARKSKPSVVLPYLDYKSDLPYHTSAILGAALDTITLPHRLDRPESLLHHLAQALTPAGKKVLGAYSSLPFPMRTDSTLADSLLQLGDTLPWQPLTPGCHGNRSCAAQSLVVRGIPADKLKGAVAVDPERARALDRCDNIQQLMSLYLTEMCDCSLNAICGVREPCKVGAPYPHIFTPNVSKNGQISDQDRSAQTGVDEVPMMTSLQSTTAVYNTLRHLVDDVRTINIKRHHRILDDGLEEDDYKESLNNLEHLMERYDDDSHHL